MIFKIQNQLLYMMCFAAGFSIAAEPIKKELTLETTINLALENNPVLAVYSADIQAKEAATLQARLWKNPELGAVVENIAGKNKLDGFDGAETTLSLSQPIELGGKRKRRRDMATWDIKLAAWNFQSQKRDLIASVSKAFIKTLIAQERVLLNNEMLKLAEQMTHAVTEKVGAGKVSPVEKSKANIELAAVRTAAEKAVRALAVAKNNLAGFWRPDKTGFLRAVGEINDLIASPDQNLLLHYLEKNPDWARWENEKDRSNALLDTTRSEKWPDISVRVGYRHFNETDNHAFLSGVSLPLPFFNRNQGDIAQAQTQLEMVEAKQQSARISLQTQLAETCQTLASAYDESTALQDDVLPHAQKVYDATDRGYREGKMDFLQLLDAQRALFIFKRQYLSSLDQYHITRIELERLIGVSLKEVEK